MSMGPLPSPNIPQHNAEPVYDVKIKVVNLSLIIINSSILKCYLAIMKGLCDPMHCRYAQPCNPISSMERGPEYKVYRVA